MLVRPDPVAYHKTSNARLIKAFYTSILSIFRAKLYRIRTVWQTSPLSGLFNLGQQVSAATALLSLLLLYILPVLYCGI